MYKIKLENFEGPLDLLLFFVRKDELDVYDIPIAYITKTYLDYLKLMQDLNLDIASEFILMAATLMRIKVRSMLPPEPGEENEEEPLDPREELTRRLIEYRQFKEASKSLSNLDDQWRMIYRRNYFDADRLPPSEEAMGLKNISFFDLLAAYKKAVSKTSEVVFHNVERLNVTVEQQMVYIRDFFHSRKGALFTELCEGMSKIEIVVTFLAILDMIRRKEIFVRQSSVFDDIWMQKEKPDDAEELQPAEHIQETESEQPVITPDITPPDAETDFIPQETQTEEHELNNAESDVTETAETIEKELTETEAATGEKEEQEVLIPEDHVDISCLTEQLKPPYEQPVPDQLAGDEMVSSLDTNTADQQSTETAEAKRNSDAQWIEEVQECLIRKDDHAEIEMDAAEEPSIEDQADEANNNIDHDPDPDERSDSNIQEAAVPAIEFQSDDLNLESNEAIPRELLQTDLDIQSENSDEHIGVEPISETVFIKETIPVQPITENELADESSCETSDLAPVDAEENVYAAEVPSIEAQTESVNNNIDPDPDEQSDSNYQETTVSPIEFQSDTLNIESKESIHQEWIQPDLDVQSESPVISESNQDIHYKIPYNEQKQDILADESKKEFQPEHEPVSEVEYSVDTTSSDSVENTAEINEQTGSHTAEQNIPTGTDETIDVSFNDHAGSAVVKDQEPKPSVIKLFFSKVFSFVKKIFKR